MNESSPPSFPFFLSFFLTSFSSFSHITYTLHCTNTLLHMESQSVAAACKGLRLFDRLKIFSFFSFPAAACLQSYFRSVLGLLTDISSSFFFFFCFSQNLASGPVMRKKVVVSWPEEKSQSACCIIKAGLHFFLLYSCSDYYINNFSRSIIDSMIFLMIDPASLQEL